MKNPTPPSLPFPLLFIDLETTGTNFARDRILEIGCVEVQPDAAGGYVVSEWSSLINPEAHVTPFITGLTGIDGAMVEHAPVFAEIAPALHERLHGKCFVAHNARFDYGFLKAEFARVGIVFQTTAICTVKLSRRLNPKAGRHNLDTLIERHAITVDSRHRALADARVLWQLWQAWQTEFGETAFEHALATLTRPVTLPDTLDPALADELPECAGAYALYDADEQILRVARAGNLRSVVLALFADGKSTQAPFCHVRRIGWRPAAGEFGARLAEIAFRKIMKKETGQPYAWRLVEASPGDFICELVNGETCVFGYEEALYGPYNSPREARQTLHKLAEVHGLCLKQIGLEAAKPGAACHAYASRQCRGACVGKESALGHSARLMAALERQKISRWPYKGPIAVVERDEFGMYEDFHLFDAWQYLGHAQSEEQLADLIGNKKSGIFCPVTYRLLLKTLQGGGLRVVLLDGKGDASPME